MVSSIPLATPNSNPNPNPSLAGVGEEGVDEEEENSSEESLQITRVSLVFPFMFPDDVCLRVYLGALHSTF